MNLNLDIYTIAIILSLIGITIIAFWMKYKLQKIYLRFVTLRKENQQIKNNIKIVTTGALGISEKLNKLENNIQFINQKKLLTNISKNTSKENIYSIAKLLAIQGGSIEDIVKSCKISKTEAELIISSVKKTK